jgi:hypothetical protein
MRIVPSTKQDWFALIVFPFKAYVVGVVPLYFVFRVFCPEPSWPTGTTDGTGIVLFEAFIASGLFLLLGAIVQLIFWLAFGQTDSNVCSRSDTGFLVVIVEDSFR